jgi:hypothetical protein
MAKTTAIATGVVSLVLISAGYTTAALAQRPTVHYRYTADMPPGAIGQQQLLRGGPLPGYFQPVELRAPEGAMVALEVDGAFEPPESNVVKAGMLIGQVYRCKITRIPRNEGLEVYPTIEVIDRLYPPPGHAARFPIPIHLTSEELEFALDGRFVTRVIYLENPTAALPSPDDPNDQRYFDVSREQDPLQTADELGRPVAILRMGSRIPDEADSAGGAIPHSPPLIKYAATMQGDEETIPPAPKSNAGSTTLLESQRNHNVPRLPGQFFEFPIGEIGRR